MKSYLKFLSRNKLYTAIEFVGLAVSLAFVILIGSYVWQQFAVTREHPDRERIYVPGMPDYPGMTYGFPELFSEIPEIEDVAKLSFLAPTYGKHDVLYGAAVDRAFFEMFPRFRFLEGDADALFSGMNVLVAESFARKNDLSLGDNLTLDGKDFTVAAIFEDIRGTVFNPYEVFLPTEHFQDRWAPFDNFGSTLCFRELTARSCMIR